MYEIHSLRSFAGIGFGAKLDEVVAELGDPESRREYPDGSVQLSYDNFSLFIDPAHGFEHVQIEGFIPAAVNGTLTLEWSLEFVNRLAQMDGDARLKEDGDVLIMRKLGVVSLGFHDGMPGDRCIGFDGPMLVDDKRYPEDSPRYQI